MARAMRPRYQFGNAVRERSVSPGDFSNATIVDGEEVTIWSTDVPADKVYVWGSGRNARDAGNANFIFAEILADGSGTGTDGNAIRDAELVVAVTDSVQEDTIAKTTVGNLGDLADAKADNPSDRPIFPEHAPGASEDRHIEIRVRGASGSDGKVVANDSNLSFKYGVVDVV